MTHLRTAAAVLFVCTALSAAAGAQAPLGAIGGEMQDPRTAVWTAPRLSGNTEITARPAFATAFMGLNSAGYAWNDRVRTEIERHYQGGGIAKISGLAAYGNVRTSAVSANVIYALKSDPKGTAYLGGGVGLNGLEWPLAAAQAVPSFKDRTTRVQWHGIAGVTRRLSPRLDAFVDYRRVTSGKSRLVNPPAGSSINARRDRSHNILAGVRFALNP